MQDFREVGRKLSNWGRWGDDDRLGTLNHITAERLVAAAALVKRGAIFDLGLPVGGDGIQVGAGGRINPVHTMSMVPGDFRLHDHHIGGGMFCADDYIYMPLQSVTQWDSLAHAGYDGKLYNNVDESTVTSTGGSAVISIDQIAEKGVAGRGVLLDIARLKGVDRLEAGFAIYPDDLLTAEREQGVRFGPGDILIVRTGWIQKFTVDGAAAEFWNGCPGIHLDCLELLQEREIAAIASDNAPVEVVAKDAAIWDLPVHAVALRDMGLTLGEIFVLESLADDCARDGIWEFFFAAPPLKVKGGVGTPLTPLAIK